MKNLQLNVYTVMLLESIIVVKVDVNSGYPGNNTRGISGNQKNPYISKTYVSV